MFEIAQDSLYTYPMGLFGFMHELSNTMNDESNIKLSELEIMKAANNAFVQGRIIKLCIKLCSISGCQFHNGGHWSGTRLGTIHFGFCKKVNNVSALSEMESYSIMDSFNA